MRRLGLAFYDEDLIEAFIAQVGTMDDVMLSDGTYFAAFVGNLLVGCGGWSQRTPNYASHTASDTDRTETRSATIRSIFRASRLGAARHRATGDGAGRERYPDRGPRACQNDRDIDRRPVLPEGWLSERPADDAPSQGQPILRRIADGKAPVGPSALYVANRGIKLRSPVEGRPCSTFLRPSAIPTCRSCRTRWLRPVSRR